MGTGNATANPVGPVTGGTPTYSYTSSIANGAKIPPDSTWTITTDDPNASRVEFYADNTKDKGDYVIGEAFDKTGEGLRRMDDPSSDGSSVNCYSSNIGDLDVHYSSGLGNHFFYLLAEGSGAKTINGIAQYSSKF